MIITRQTIISRYEQQLIREHFSKITYFDVNNEFNAWILGGTEK